jgi:hypothetical protein
LLSSSFLRLGASRRLEESQNSIETIAEECGFGNVNSMRTVFQRALKIAPGQYRRHFRSQACRMGFRLLKNGGLPETTSFTEPAFRPSSLGHWDQFLRNLFFTSRFGSRD